MNLNYKDILGIIPARYNSTRLLGKALMDIDGKTMIQHVYERANQVLENVIVATDDDRIYKTVINFGGNCIMTDSNHSTGTNRCLEAYQKWVEQTKKDYKIILNIQGDEPLLNDEHLKNLISCFEDKTTSIASLGLQVKHDEILNEGSVYIVLDENNFALYFSRFPIPFLRDIPKDKWTQHHNYYKHIGIYGFTKSALNNFASMKSSSLEKSEKLEQLRWMEAGNKIKIAITNAPSIPVDTREDLDAVRKLF